MNRKRLCSRRYVLIPLLILYFCMCGIFVYYGTDEAVVASEKFPNVVLSNTSHRQRIFQTSKGVRQEFEDRDLPRWQLALKQHERSRVPKAKKKYNLTHLLQVRIYETDLAAWTLSELKQWMHYMLWSGVEHFYIGDHFKYEHEMLDKKLQRYIDAGIVTYFPWNWTRDAMHAQTSFYSHIIKSFGNQSRWQISVDIDEYPYYPNDAKEGFLVRYLDRLPANVGAILLPNYLMLGEGDRRRNMTIERITRRTRDPANNLVKPVFRPLNVAGRFIHTIPLKGKAIKCVPKEDILMLHYWGSRIERLGQKNTYWDKTVDYTAMRDSMSEIVRNSLLAFGERHSFNNSSGP